MTRQKRVLFILVGILLLAVYYGYSQFPRQSRVTDTFREEKSTLRQPVRRKVGTEEETHFRVRFDWLKNENPFSGAKQDLFGSLYGVDQQGPAVLPEKKESVPEGPEIRKKNLSFGPPLEFLGYLASENGKTFFFSQGDDLFVARRGKEFGKKREYRIAQVAAKEIKVKKKGEPGLLTLSTVAQPPLPKFNKPRVQNSTDDLLPNEDFSPTDNPDEMNEAPTDGAISSEPDNNAENEQPAEGILLPGGSWEKQE